MMKLKPAVESPLPKLLMRSLERIQLHPFIIKARSLSLSERTLERWLQSFDTDRVLFGDALDILRATCLNKEVLRLAIAKRDWDEEVMFVHRTVMGMCKVNAQKIKDGEERVVRELTSGVQLATVLTKFATTQHKMAVVAGFLSADAAVVSLLSRAVIGALKQHYGLEKNGFETLAEFIHNDQPFLRTDYNEDDFSFGIRIKENATVMLLDDVFEVFPKGYCIPPYEFFHWR